ncbi:unnamed protein product [Effrenium voratum]|nr:unnamed protein product [Effrenium voratum]
MFSFAVLLLFVAMAAVAAWRKQRAGCTPRSNEEQFGLQRFRSTVLTLSCLVAAVQLAHASALRDRLPQPLPSLCTRRPRRRVDAMAMKLHFRTMDGETLGPISFQGSDFVYSVAQQLKLHCAKEDVAARLTFQGRIMAPGARLSEILTQEESTLELLWLPWLGDMQGKGERGEAFDRRKVSLEEMQEGASRGSLQAVGHFMAQAELQLWARNLVPLLASLRVLDLRQCGLWPVSLRPICEKASQRAWKSC